MTPRGLGLLRARRWTGGAWAANGSLPGTGLKVNKFRMGNATWGVACGTKSNGAAPAVWQWDGKGFTELRLPDGTAGEINSVAVVAEAGAIVAVGTNRLVLSYNYSIADSWWREDVAADVRAGDLTDVAAFDRYNIQAGKLPSPFPRLNRCLHALASTCFPHHQLRCWRRHCGCSPRCQALTSCNARPCSGHQWLICLLL